MFNREFSSLQVPGRKGFLKLSQITQKQAGATEKYPHNIYRAKILVFIRFFFGMAHCVLWRCRHKPGATFNYDIITEAEAALEKLNFKDL